MSIICFEGASAVGKTALSAYLRDNYSAFVIPEVNLLFEGKETEPKFWYFEKQIERWKMAVEAAKNHKIAILDGDPFQPLWYNWSYNFDFGEPLETIAGFYKEKLAAGEIDFPDRYFILTAESGELRNRKTNDALRTRKNFERHLRFIQPQIACFNFIKSISYDLVEFIENTEIEESAEKIIYSIGDDYSGEFSSRELFGEIENWLKQHDAEEFISLP